MSKKFEIPRQPSRGFERLGYFEALRKITDEGRTLLYMQGVNMIQHNHGVIVGYLVDKDADLAPGNTIRIDHIEDPGQQRRLESLLRTELRGVIVFFE